MRQITKIVLFLSTLLIPGVIWCQATGTINGSVIDASGAVISGAKVTAIEAQTNVARTVTSGSDGLYVFTALRPTNYIITVEAAGFETLKQTSVVLQANNTLTVNLTLSVGSVTESVTIDTSVPTADTTSSTISQVVDSARIVELPLNGRNAATLTSLVPGSVNAPNHNADEGLTKTFPGAVTISMNGSRPNQVSYYLDGVPNTDFLSNVNLPFPMPDALQEFSVQSANYQAEFGQSSGGVVNIVTRSGTNGFHGTVFDYIRNGYFNARNFFATKVDPLKRQQFGGTIGGPIMRNKLFFMFGYQGTRIRTATSATSTVPTTSQINSVPIGSRDPASYALLEWLPISTGTSGLVTYSIGQRQNLDEYTARGDWTLSDKDRLLVRYYQNVFNQPANLTDHNLLTYADFVKFNYRNVTFTETHTFNANILNQLSFGYMRETDFRGPPSNTPTVNTFGVNITQDTVAAIEGITVSGAFTFGSFPQGQFPRTGYFGGDTFRWQHGNHSIAFGGGYERDYLYEFTATNSNGVFNFNTLPGSLATPIQNFLMGKLNTFTQGNGYVQDNSYTLFSLFAQDTWKASPRWTFNYGVRWEPSRPWNDLYHEATVFQADGFSAGRKSIVYPNAPAGLYFPGDAGIPSNGRRSDWANISPRAGFAWDVFGTGKTSLRGGAGWFFDSRVPGFANNRVSQATPFSLAVTLTQPAGTFSNPYLGVTNPFPAALPPPKTTAFPSPVLVYSWDVKQRLSSENYAANLTLEQQLAPALLLRVGYVGVRGKHLGVSIPWNPANPNGVGSTDQRRLYLGYGNILMQSSSGSSRYNSLQTSLQKAFTKGYTVTLNYTWSKGIDDTPVGMDPVTPNVGTTYAKPITAAHYRDLDTGPAETDYNHHVTMSYVAQIPFPGKNSFARAALGGWELNGILVAQTGGPLILRSGNDRSLTNIGYDRVDLVPSQKLYSSGYCSSATATSHCVNYLNQAAYAQPAIGTFGSISRGAVRGPGQFTWDMGVKKGFHIVDRLSAQFRAEYFNVFNRTNYMDPTLTRNSGTFGEITSARDPRIAQFAVKLSF